MNLITCFELASKSTSELRGLYRDAFNALVRSVPGTPGRRNALASLDNIEAELAARTLEL